MRASEFIKKYGLEEAKLLIERHKNTKGEFITVLKRLIDAHDFVEEMGGYEYVKMQ